MFLGPKLKLYDFLVKCLLRYKTLFFKKLDPKSHLRVHNDPKTKKITFFKFLLFLDIGVKGFQV